MNDGASLREARKAAGLTQQALADRSGIERDKIAKIETDVRRLTGTEAIYLADAIGISADQLLGRREPTIQYRAADEHSAQVREIADWFRRFVEDALFLDRTADKYGLE